MATTSTRPSSSKRKRNQETDAAAMPFRRSRRVAFRDPFRFDELAPELRNGIYSMALRNGVSRGLRGTSLPLTGKWTAEAKALSQVSRSVRAESMSIYYSKNTFHAHLGREFGSRDPWRALDWIKEVSRIEEWSLLFGELVAPLIPSLRIYTAMNMWHNYQRGSIDFKDPLQPLSWVTEEERGYEVSQTAKTELEAFTLAVLRPQNEIICTATTLRLLLLGLQVVTEQHSARRPEDHPVTVLLHLESQTELQGFLPHIAFSPKIVIFDFR